MTQPPDEREAIVRIASGLTCDEVKVIRVLGHYHSETGFTSFKHTGERCGMNAAQVGPILRKLRRLGLTEFGSGLMTEDGELYGSGYAINDKGRAVRDHLSEQGEGYE